MSSVQPQRELISEQETPAEEALSEFKEIIVKTEEESDDPCRHLDFIRTPQIILHRIDLPVPRVVKKEVLVQERLFDPERISHLDLEEAELLMKKEEWEKRLENHEIKEEQEEIYHEIKEEQEEISYHEIKEEQEEISYHEIKKEQEELAYHEIKEEQKYLTCHEVKEEQEELSYHDIKEEQEELEHQLIKEEQDSPDKEHVVVKLETDIFTVTPTSDDKYHTELNRNLLMSQDSIETQNNEGNNPNYSGSNGNEQLKRNESCWKSGQHDGNADGTKQNGLQKTQDRDLYSCIICEKNFSENSLLTKHMKIHTDEKLYSCKICGKISSQKSHLTAHIRTHTVLEKWKS
ncbi:uncharacterized protein V3H82_019096 [Fundulus diaphanus]